MRLPLRYATTLAFARTRMRPALAHALALALAFAAACGGDGSGPSDSGIRIDGPSSLRMTWVGEQVQLHVTNVDAALFRWSSTNTAVATIDRSGIVTAVGPGTADIIALALDGQSADSVRLAVEPEIAELVFLAPLDHAVAGQTFLRPVRVGVVDRGGTPIIGSVIPIRLTMDFGVLEGTTTKATTDGIATFDDLRIPTLGTGYRIEAATPDNLRLVLSNPFDVVSAPDHIEAHNGGTGPLGLFIDGTFATGFVNDGGLVLNGTETDLVLSAGPGEVMAFMRGRPPVIVPAPWTDGPDTVAWTFPDALSIPVTVWVVKGPYAEQQARAAAAVATTTLIWDDQLMGLSFAEVEYVDATADPDAPRFYDLTLCNQQAGMTSDIGKRAGRINIYYVGTVDGGTDRGRACPGLDFAVMAERSGHELLSHEIGHLFGLGHVDNEASFDQTNVMHSASNSRRYLTEPQVMRSHYNSFGALRSVYGLRTDPPRDCGDFQVSNECPALRRRLFADGTFPADQTLSMVEAALLESCAMGGEAPLPAEGALLDALDGPADDLVRDVTTSARERADAITAAIARGQTFGLETGALARMRAALDPDRVRDAFVLSWREAAVRDLGRVGGRRAVQRLRALADDPASPLRPAARRALGR